MSQKKRPTYKSGDKVIVEIIHDHTGRGNHLRNVRFTVISENGDFVECVPRPLVTRWNVFDRRLIRRA